MKCFSVKTVIRPQAGFTIVELLVAMAISLILLTAVYQVFLANTQTYRMNENQARLQENGRFALDFLTREVRSAGYYGCFSDSGNVQTTLNSSSSFLYDFNQAVEGFESTSATVWGPTVDASITSPLGSSDILTIRRIDPTVSMRVSSDMAVSNDTVALTGVPTLGDILLINDCQEAWVFQMTGLDSGEIKHEVTGTPAPGNSRDNFTYGFAAGTDVFKIETVSYYIRNNDEVPPQPSLYRKIGSAAAEEILQGIENMQILYGEDTNNDGDVEFYRTANNVAAWNNVLSVRIGLLVRTPNEIAKGDLDTTVYTINGKDVDPTDDRRQRRVFSATIGLRNKLL